MLSDSLNHWLSTWWESRANPGEFRCMQCPVSDQKGWSQDLPHPRPHLRVGSGGKGILLEIPVYVRPSEDKQLLSLISVPVAVVFVQTLTCCSLRSCHSTIITVLSLHYSITCVKSVPFRTLFVQVTTMWVHSSVKVEWYTRDTVPYLKNYTCE